MRRSGTMSNPMQRLKESLLAAPIIWKGDYPYFIHPLTDGVPRLEPSVLTAVVELIENAVHWDSIDLVLGIEAMGLPLTSPLSMRNNRPQVVVRKRSYGLEGELAIDQSTGYSKGEMFLNDIKQGERLLIVDDVLSTGVPSMPSSEVLNHLVQSLKQSLLSSKRGRDWLNCKKNIRTLKFHPLFDSKWWTVKSSFSMR